MMSSLFLPCTPGAYSGAGVGAPAAPQLAAVEAVVGGLHTHVAYLPFLLALASRAGLPGAGGACRGCRDGAAARHRAH